MSVRNGRATKVPSCSTKGGPWGTAQEVLATLPEGNCSPTQGLGLVMTGPVELEEGCSLFALDIDGCRNPVDGTVQDWARELVKQFGSYTEITPSKSGLRVFGFVKGAVPALRVIHVPGDVAGGSHRRREIQVFGHGPASYVTVTGDVVDGSPALLHSGAEAFKWLVTKYPQGIAPPEEPLELHPVGTAPTVEALDAFVRSRATPDDLRLLDGGDWQSCALPSASEGWFQLVQLVTMCCADHLDVATSWLLHHTAYGRGEIEDSKDPLRYGDEVWVTTDLRRVLRKRRAAVADVFSPIDTGGRPPLSEGQRGPFEPSLDSPWETAAPTAPAAPEPPEDDRFFEPLASLVARDPRPSWLVHGLIERNCLVALSGAPGSYKSFLAIDVALAMATGQRWHGRTTRKCPTLLLAGEGHGGLTRRFKAWFADHDVSPAGVPIAVSRHAGRLLDDKAFEFLVTEAKLCAQTWRQSPGLIIIDTLNRNFGPGDENSTEDVTKFIERCDTLRRVFPDVTLMLVHHVGHSASNRSRGSSVLGGAVDAEIILTRDRDAKTDRPKPGARVVFRKMKDAEGPEPFWIVPRHVELGVDHEGAPYGSLVIDRVCDEAPTSDATPLDDPDFQRDISILLRVLLDNPTACKADIDEATYMTRRRINQVLDVVTEFGLLEFEGSTNNRLYTVTAQGIERLSCPVDLPDGLSDAGRELFS